MRISVNSLLLCLSPPKVVLFIEMANIVYRHFSRYKRYGLIRRTSFPFMLYYFIIVGIALLRQL